MGEEVVFFGEVLVVGLVIGFGSLNSVSSYQI